MRVLILTNPGTNSRGLLFDMADGLRRLGHDTLHLDLAAIWHLRERGGSPEMVTHAFAHLVREFIETNAIDFSIAMWANGTLSLPILRDDRGRLTAYLDTLEHPHVHVWWDAPHWFNNGAVLPAAAGGLFASPRQLHTINNAYTAAEMNKLLGFGNVLVMPNAANPDVFHPLPEARREYDLVFLSGGGDPPPTPTMLEELAADAPDLERIRRSVAAGLAPALDRIAAAFEPPARPRIRRLLDALIELRLADRHQPALRHFQQAARADAALADAAALLTRAPERYVEATAVIRTIETWERPFMVAFLSRHFRCLRLGNQSYADWGLRGDAIEFVEYHRQSHAYARARFALNVMRWQDDAGLNSKVFEITAAGCGCLQAYREGVAELFDVGREIVVFRTPAEARDLLADLLRNPGRQADLIAAGRARTLAEHTWAHRMQRLVEAVRAMKPLATEVLPPRRAVPDERRDALVT